MNPSSAGEAGALTGPLPTLVEASRPIAALLRCEADRAEP